MIHNKAQDGFPYDKVEVAQRWVYGLKPYWLPLVNGIEIVPSATPTLPGEPYAAMASSDGHGRIYIDRSFALNASISDLATAIEFQYHLYFRRFWQRFGDLDPDTWWRLVPLAMSMEITSTLAQERKQLSWYASQIRRSPDVLQQNSSYVLSEIIGLSASQVEEYDLYFEPLLNDGSNIGAVLPGDLGFPSGLSAEAYIDMMLALDRQETDVPVDDIDGDPMEGETGQGDSDSGDQNRSADSESNSDESLPESESMNGTDQERDATEQNESSNVETDDAIDDDSELAQDTDQDCIEGATDSAGDSPAENGAGMKGCALDSDSASDQSDATNDADDEQNQNSEANNEYLDSDTGDTGVKEPLGNSIDQIRADSGASMFLSSFHNPQYPLDVNQMIPDVMEFESDELSEAKVESVMSDLYDAYALVCPDESLLSDEPVDVDDGSMAKLALLNRRRNKTDFVSQLRLAAMGNVHSAKVNGASDTSLSVRNPNQPMVGVIMPGEYEYSPTVYVVQDVSRSMSQGRGYAAGLVVQNIISDVATHTGARVTWIAADFGIKYVDEVSHWEDSQIFQVGSYIHAGATDLSNVAIGICQNGFDWEGVHYPPPDTLFMVTDCEFAWPEQRPELHCSWLIVTWPKQQDYLPSWLRPDEVIMAY